MKPVNAVSLQDVRDVCNAISEDNLMFSFSATTMKMVIALMDKQQEVVDAANHLCEIINAEVLTGVRDHTERQNAENNLVLIVGGILTLCPPPV